MKKLNKIITLLLFSVFGCSIVGCGSSAAPTKDIVSVNSNELVDNTNKGNSGSDISHGTTTDEKTVSKGDAGKSSAFTISEQELVNQNGIVITAVEYATDSFWGDGVKFLIENNSSQNVTVSCKALMVNDYMISDLFSQSVAAGKKANEVMHLYSNELKAAGIENIGKIEMVFHVYDSDSWKELFDTDVVTIKTSEYGNMDVATDIAGTVLYDEGGIKIIGKAVDENSFWGSSILLYIENNSGDNVRISCDDMSINGFMMTPFFSSMVYSGKKAVDDITIMSSELKKNSIESVDEVELSFRISNADTYRTITETAPITFHTK